MQSFDRTASVQEPEESGWLWSRIEAIPHVAKAKLLQQAVSMDLHICIASELNVR